MERLFSVTYSVDRRRLELADLFGYQVPVPRAEDVLSNFDHISYFKGESVIRMIFAILGRQKFQLGLNLYMTRHKYTNTVTAQLWQAWEDVSGV